ncbi:MAG: hypothetical protein WCF78_01865 [archaeon]
MPGKPNYKPKMQLLERLQKEKATLNKESKKASLAIKYDLKDKLSEKIKERKMLENNKTRYAIAGEIFEANLGKREELIQRLINELGIRIPLDRFKGTHLKRITELNKEINNIIQNSKVHNATYFQKIEKEYTSSLVREIKRTLDAKGEGSKNLGELAKFLENIKAEVTRASYRQKSRIDYFK